MDTKRLKSIIKLLKENNLQEIEVEENGLKIRVKSGIEGTLVSPAALPQPPEAVEVKPSVKEKKVESKYKVIKSPMVGTFYISPSPDDPPFVTEGDVVKKGQTLCIVEAMKLMNEIEAEFKGKIVSVLVENGQPVEYGESLFEIEPV